MRISDWSSDVCSSDLAAEVVGWHRMPGRQLRGLVPTVAGGVVVATALLRVAQVDQHQCIVRATVVRALQRIARQVVVAAGGVRDTGQIGRAHACNPVTNAPISCRLLAGKKNTSMRERLQ